MEWIFLTLFAAVMQVARTGCQKSLTSQLNDYAVTWTRFGFALPFVPLMLLASHLAGVSLPVPDAAFIGYAAAASFFQIFATVLLVRLFSRRNFASCTAFSKTEAAQIALWGALFFGLPLSAGGVAAVALGAAGALLLMPRAGGDRLTVVSGLAAGGGFAMTALFIKQAVLHVPHVHPLSAAATTLSLMLVFQSVVWGAYLRWRNLLRWKDIANVRWRAAAVGACGFLGSAGWAGAFALAHPALVKTLAQVELPLAWLLGRAAFGEKPRPAELWGMGACAAAAVVAAFA